MNFGSFWYDAPNVNTYLEYLMRQNSEENDCTNLCQVEFMFVGSCGKTH